MKLTRLHKVLTMTKEYNQSIQQNHMHMERAKIQYARKKEIKCNDIMKQCKND